MPSIFCLLFLCLLRFILLFNAFCAESDFHFLIGKRQACFSLWASYQWWKVRHVILRVYQYRWRQGRDRPGRGWGWGWGSVLTRVRFALAKKNSCSYLYSYSYNTYSLASIHTHSHTYSYTHRNTLIRSVVFIFICIWHSTNIRIFATKIDGQICRHFVQPTGPNLIKTQSQWAPPACLRLSLSLSLCALPPLAPLLLLPLTCLKAGYKSKVA